MRLPWAAFGLIFIVFGALGLVLALFAVIARGEYLLALGIVPAMLALGIGLLITAGIPWDVQFDDRGLTMYFALRTVDATWSQIRSFRKLVIRMSFRGGEATVYTLLSYCRPDGSAAYALLMLPGKGAAFSLSPSDYETELDRRIPRKSANAAACTDSPR
jgi:hypothetical protein